MEKKEKVRIGIIGCGQIVRLRHAPELAALSDGEIAGFYDFVPEHARELAEKYGGKVYDSYEDMLKDETVDGVIICTSNNSHAPISVEALKHDKCVLCEKPMCVSLEEAEEILKAEKESKGFYMAAHNQRFSLGHRKAREIIESGIMGKVLSFKCTLAHPGPECYSINRSSSTWYLKKSASGLGCISDLGIHKCDVLSYMLGERFVSVGAFAGTRDKKDENGNYVDIKDNAVCILKTESGILGSLLLSYTNYGGRMENGEVIYCEKGVIRAQYYPDCVLEVKFDEGETIRYMNKENPTSGVPEAFVKAIAAGGESPVKSEAAQEAMKVVCAIAESADTGKIIEL